MRRKTIAIVGSGPGLGYGIAEFFGERGYQPILISRSQSNMQPLIDKLAAKGITASGIEGDVLDPSSLERAVHVAEKSFDGIDVLEFSPMVGANPHVLDAERDDFEYQLKYSILGAVTAVRAVLPQMIDRGDGALLFTTGASSIVPIPSHGAGGTGQAALRNYAHVLNEALSAKGVYAGTITIADLIAGSALATAAGAASGIEPRTIAATYWDMCTKRDRAATILGDAGILTELERSQGEKIASTNLDQALARAKQNPS